MVIDFHIHINNMVLKNPQKYIAEINNNHNIKSVINVGLNIETSNESLMISNKIKKFYSTVEINPLYTESQDIDSIYKLGINDKVVAIGEIGLDSTKDNFNEQKN